MTDPYSGQLAFFRVYSGKMNAGESEFNVGANVGKPQVAYRETIRNIAESVYTHKKQTGGRGQYARTKLRVEPNPGKGYEFVNEIRGGNIPKEFIPAVEKGVVEALEG